MRQVVPIDTYFSVPRGTGSATVIANPKPHPSVSSSTGDDGGTVEGLARLCGGGISRHNSIGQMVNNLKGQRSGTIVGHGAPGFLEVGDGPWGFTPDGHISLDNQENWVEKLKLMWRKEEVWPHPYYGKEYYYSPIFLIACSVAGSTEGIELLQKMADITNRMFQAATGLVYYMYDRNTRRGISYVIEKGHTWQRVYPKGAIVVGHSLQNKIADSKDDHLPDHLKILDINEFAAFQDVVSVRVKLFHSIRFLEREFSQDAAKVILGLLFVNLPFAKSGAAIGMITAQISITYNNQPGQTFNVHSDRLAESTSSGESYIISPDFRATLLNLFNS